MRMGVLFLNSNVRCFNYVFFVFCCYVIMFLVFGCYCVFVFMFLYFCWRKYDYVSLCYNDVLGYWVIFLLKWFVGLIFFLRWGDVRVLFLVVFDCFYGMYSLFYLYIIIFFYYGYK